MGACCNKVWGKIDLNILIFTVISFSTGLILILSRPEDETFTSLGRYIIVAALGAALGAFRSKPKAKIDSDLLATIPSLRHILNSTEPDAITIA